MELVAVRCTLGGISERGVVGFDALCTQSLQRLHRRLCVQPRSRQVEHALARVQDGPVTGAAAQVARQVVGQLLAAGAGAAGLVAFVGGPQRHHKTRCAKAALRAVALDHRPLHRVQNTAGRLVLQVFHGEQGFAMQRGQELDTGVDRLQAQAIHHVGSTSAVCNMGSVGVISQLTNHHGACTTVTFVAPLFGARAARVLAQPVEHGTCGVGACHLDGLAAVEKADGLGTVIHRAPFGSFHNGR